MASWTGVTTNAGVRLMAGWTSGTTLNIDKAVAGEGCAPIVSLLAQTALVKEKQEISIVSSKIENDARKIKVQIQSGEEGYLLNQIGLFASVDGGEQVLLALFQNERGIDIPSFAESPDFLYTFYCLLTVSNEGDFSITVNPSALVSYETMEAFVEEKTASEVSKKFIETESRTFSMEDVLQYGENVNYEWYRVSDATPNYYDLIGGEFVCNYDDGMGDVVHKITGADIQKVEDVLVLFGGFVFVVYTDNAYYYSPTYGDLSFAKGIYFKDIEGARSNSLTINAKEMLDPQYLPCDIEAQGTASAFLNRTTPVNTSDGNYYDYMARGSRFHSVDNPDEEWVDYDGAINWQYG